MKKTIKVLLITCFIIPLIPTLLNAAINSNIKVTPDNTTTPERRVINKTVSSYGYGKDSTDLETKISEWKKNATKQIEQIDKEIQKLQDRKIKINNDLEEKILNAINKTNSSYGVNNNEITNISYTIFNGYSGMSSVFDIDKEGVMKITENNILKDTSTITKTGKLTNKEFSDLKNIINKANVFILEDRYACTELCPTDTNDVTFMFTVGSNTKTITTTSGIDLPEKLLNIKTELIRLRNKLNEGSIGYGSKRENIIDRAINKIKNIFSDKK